MTHLSRLFTSARRLVPVCLLLPIACQTAPASDRSDGGHLSRADADVPDAAVSQCAASTSPVYRVVVFCALNRDGSPVALPVEEAVTVTRIDTATSTCGLPELGPAGAVLRRVTVQSAQGQEWDLMLDIPGLPVNQVVVGETLDMSLAVSGGPTIFGPRFNHTLVLSRDTRLVLFASTLWGANGSTAVLPDLRSWGLELSDGGVLCTSSEISCQKRQHRLGARWQGDDGTAAPGEVLRLGTLSLSVGPFEDFVNLTGGCDAFDLARVGGFVTAASGG